MSSPGAAAFPKRSVAPPRRESGQRRRAQNRHQSRALHLSRPGRRGYRRCRRAASPRGYPARRRVAAGAAGVAGSGEPQLRSATCRCAAASATWRTRGIMHALLGQKLTDTQTGLRGIPASFLPKLLRQEATGYEFELEMLIAAHQLSIPIVEVPIRTIYEAGNKSSHFNPIVDSMKIYFVLLRFGSVSVLSGVAGQPGLSSSSGAVRRIRSPPRCWGAWSRSVSTIPWCGARSFTRTSATRPCCRSISCWCWSAARPPTAASSFCTAGSGSLPFPPSCWSRPFSFSSISRFSGSSFSSRKTSPGERADRALARLFRCAGHRIPLAPGVEIYGFATTASSPRISGCRSA